ncbi:hypothetical protein BIV57_13400 [Mangrovactinospora gilvigrisea]|uniref:SAF domain-containing protein n=1 Tax=Mangrovactinospora gilvigrisea TaxID=1428644 RepID=A0A1J7C641_9ACTN|nr:hypothetical protein BIV57_13400 [Mangrovactinospora gilvigrisea]
MGAAPTAAPAPAPRRRRRPGVTALGLALVVVGALGGTALVTQAGHRDEVLAVATTVHVGQTISKADLRIAHLPSDPSVKTVPLSQAKTVIGKLAAVDIPAGSLLTPASTTSTNPLTAGKQTIGLQLKPGQLPGEAPAPGTHVLIVASGNTGDGASSGSGSSKASGSAGSIQGVVLRVGAADSNGARVVDVAVDPSDGPKVASEAASGVTLITDAS